MSQVGKNLRMQRVGQGPPCQDVAYPPYPPWDAAQHGPPLWMVVSGCAQVLSLVTGGLDPRPCPGGLWWEAGLLGA